VGEVEQRLCNLKYDITYIYMTCSILTYMYIYI